MLLSHVTWNVAVFWTYVSATATLYIQTISMNICCVSANICLMNARIHVVELITVKNNGDMISRMTLSACEPVEYFNQLVSICFGLQVHQQRLLASPPS
jgi:hypothetical protein